jgi:hypothetical protein
MGTSPVTLSKPVARSGDRFDLFAHLAGSPTPLSSLSLPRSLVSELHFRFDERLTTANDWDLVLRAALLVGVEETGQVTSIEQQPDDSAVLTAAESGGFMVARASVLAELDNSPLLLPSGNATALARLAGEETLSATDDSERVDLERELQKTKNALTRAKARPKRGQLVDESARIEGLLVNIDELERRARQAEKARDELLASEFWRMTAPLRSLVNLLRGNRRGAAGS